MGKIILKKNEERRLLSGHLWVFSNEISKIETDIPNGEIVDVFSYNNKYLGSGFYNRNSLIAVRLFTREKSQNHNDILIKNLENAFNLRKNLYPNRKSYRLVFSESDFLPGLIIDRYNYTFVLQVNSLGMEKNLSPIVDYLIDNLKAKNIFTKHDFYFRELEGLDKNNVIYYGNDHLTEVISDSVVYYKIDFQKSQKTGFFFDQVDNRIYTSKFCKDAEVLDVFANNGGFGLNALYQGAKFVTFVDYSATEINNIKENLVLNNFYKNFELVNQDAFEYLESLVAKGKKFDVVIVDPPAFTKNKKNLKNAMIGYEKLNNLAIKCVRDNGILVSASCSHHLTKDDFIRIINKAAIKNKRTIKQIYYNTAGPDHPINPAMEETQYLKFGIFNLT